MTTADIDARIDQWQRQIGDAIRTGKAYVVANPTQGWAIDVVTNLQSDWNAVHSHATEVDL